MKQKAVAVLQGAVMLSLALGSSLNADDVPVQLMGQCQLPGGAYDVAISGDHAFVIDGWCGLQIVNIANPASPTRVGEYLGSGCAAAVAASGRYAYLVQRGIVVPGQILLDVIDVSDPSSPRLIGSWRDYDVSGVGWDVAAWGDYVYIAELWAGMEIIDVHNPALPVRVGEYLTMDVQLGQAVAVTGEYAFLADDWQGLHIIDISNPAMPERVGRYGGYEEGPTPVGVAVRDGYAFLACGEDGLLVLDVSDPAAPQQAGCAPTLGYARSVAVSGGYAWVAADYAGVELIDISNPILPARVGGYTTSACVSVAASGDYAYLTDGRHSSLESEWGNLVTVRVGSGPGPDGGNGNGGPSDGGPGCAAQVGMPQLAGFWLLCCVGLVGTKIVTRMHKHRHHAALQVSDRVLRPLPGDLVADRYVGSPINMNAAQ
jgi:hypothetical protein